MCNETTQFCNGQTFHFSGLKFVTLLIYPFCVIDSSNNSIKKRTASEQDNQQSRTNKKKEDNKVHLFLL
jgi:hypothetical protein